MRKMRMLIPWVKELLQQALQDFVEYLPNSLPEQIEYVALFGSKARGDSKMGTDTANLSSRAHTRRYRGQEL